jgi:hypothetical protein
MILRNEDILLASTEFLQAADIIADLVNAAMNVCWISQKKHRRALG